MNWVERDIAKQKWKQQKNYSNFCDDSVLKSSFSGDCDKHLIVKPQRKKTKTETTTKITNNLTKYLKQTYYKYVYAWNDSFFVLFFIC